MTDDKVMKILRDIAEYAFVKSDCRRYQVGAAVKAGKGVYWGINRRKTHTKSLHPFHFIHAELDAVCAAARQHALNGATLFVGRLRKDGFLGLAKPCPSCQQMIRKCGIKTVYYSLAKEGYGIWEVQ